MTIREIIYDVREKLKTLNVSDSKVTDEYLIHLANVKRSFLLKQKYSDIRKYVPDSLKQLICMEVELEDRIEELACADKILISTEPVPELLNFGGILGINKVMSVDMISIPFNYVTMARLPYTGYNKWLTNQIYCSIGADKRLYIKSVNPQYMQIENIKIVGLFANPEIALEYMCDYDCDDILDMYYPIEESLIIQLIQMMVQELSFRESLTPKLDNDNKEPTLQNDEPIQSRENT